ncbi:unnamed protein product [Penicillium manginii]
MPENNAAAGPAEDLDANAIQKNMFVETTNLRYEATPIDPEIEKKVLRKINLFLMPAMVIDYGLVYYDKVSVLYGSTVKTRD